MAQITQQALIYGNGQRASGVLFAEFANSQRYWQPILRGAGLAGYFKRLQRGRTGCRERPEGKPAKRYCVVAALGKG